MFWKLPSGAVSGILNGMEDDSRPKLASDDMDAFFQKKMQCKLGFQEANGLKVAIPYMPDWVPAPVAPVGRTPLIPPSALLPHTGGR